MEHGSTAGGGVRGVHLGMLSVVIMNKDKWEGEVVCHCAWITWH